MRGVALGPIAVLVNNAGINKPTDFDRVTDADWDEILAANLKGPFICAQVFLPPLAEAGRAARSSISVRSAANMAARAPRITRRSKRA